MYRSNSQFVRVQEVSDSVNNSYATLDNPRILYRYEEPSNRQFAVAQNRRERFFNDIDERYERASPPYRNVSTMYCNTPECEECTCGNSNSNRYPINTVAYQSNCADGSCSLNDCQSGCCGNNCEATYNQAFPRVVYR